MSQVPVVRRAASHELATIRTIVEDIERSTGERPLNDQLWLDLLHPEQADGGFVAAVAVAGDVITAYAQASRESARWSLSVVDTGAAITDATRGGLLRTLVRGVGELGGGDVQWWSTDPPPSLEALADSLGLTGRRRLLQMRIPLPVEPEVDRTFELETRPFVPGFDDGDWLQANNRAFAGHPEQGSWNRHTLSQRQGEPWFDPDGFLLHHRDGRLAGFCWTKVHSTSHPPMGEIYVIAVDPDFHGAGLGRALTLAGLRHLASRGLGIGMLYVDATNVTAVTMYERIGFTVHHTDVACIGHVESTEHEGHPV